MVVWESPKEDIQILKNIIDIQNNLITNLLNMNQRLFEQLNMSMENKEQFDKFEKGRDNEKAMAYYEGIWRALKNNKDLDDINKGLDKHIKEVLQQQKSRYMSEKELENILRSSIYPKSKDDVENNNKENNKSDKESTDYYPKNDYTSIL